MSHVKLHMVGGCADPPQFEYNYSVHLHGRVSQEEFNATLDKINEIMDTNGSGVCNVGWLLFPLCLCLCIASCANNDALAKVRRFLDEENMNYTAKGVQWELRKKIHHHHDSDGRDSTTTETWIQIEIAHAPQVIVQNFVTPAPQGYGQPVYMAPQTQNYDPNAPLLYKQ
eukprot:TRINITY_DN179_c0_g1_i1.p1 TRINITY_DN179_c0_g1~~TRINITY_DN179_c0_g1_i1.p1  ORF type:complete len:170 (+),score=32.93 TRINITY_DN179_c0_g1_i1:100-609(+)